MSSFSTGTQYTVSAESRYTASAESQYTASAESRYTASAESRYTASAESRYTASAESQSTASAASQSTVSTGMGMQPIASTEVQETMVVMPRQTLQGHTRWVNGVVHLPGEQHIVTCSSDSSLRLWDLESGTQIGEDWRDEDDEGLWSMALSPNGETIASGSEYGKINLWDVRTRKVITNWTGHADVVGALCWNADGNQVLSGSWDGTARVWHVESGQTVLKIKTGHEWVNAVIYSPDATKIATGGRDWHAVQIWDATMGELLNTLPHNQAVCSLAWTSDGEKLISGSSGPIRIFNTATWQEITVLKGHWDTHRVNAISLSFNERFLASASLDKTTRLWNLKTSLPVGASLQHEGYLHCAAISTDGKLLVTGSENTNAYTWDIHAILKDAGIEELLQPLSNVAAQKSLMDAQVEDNGLSPGFFNDVTDGAYSSRTYGNHYRSSSCRPRTLAPSLGSVRALFGRLSSPFHRFQRHTNEEIELPQRSGRAILFRHHPRVVEVAAVKDREVIFTAPPPPEKKQQQNQSHAQGSSTTQPAPGVDPTSQRARYAHSLPIRLLGHLVLFLCCASPRHADGNARPTQQQQQQGPSESQAQGQLSSSQTESAVPSSSTAPPAPPASGAATMQS